MGERVGAFPWICLSCRLGIKRLSSDRDKAWKPLAFRSSGCLQMSDLNFYTQHWTSYVWSTKTKTWLRDYNKYLNGIWDSYTLLEKKLFKTPSTVRTITTINAKSAEQSCRQNKGTWLVLQWAGTALWSSRHKPPLSARDWTLWWS